MRYDPAHKVDNMIWVLMLHCYGMLKLARRPWNPEVTSRRIKLAVYERVKRG
jgi:hypothetical protein